MTSFTRILKAIAAVAGVLGASAGTAPAWAAPVQTDHVQSELIAEMQSVQPGQPFTVGLRLKMDPHWHTYWRNPGDSGLATTIAWTLPSGFKAGAIEWPTPHKLPVSTLINYGYENEVLLMTQITPPASLPVGSQIQIGAHGDWLVCVEECIPGEADYQLSLPVKAGPPALDPHWSALFAQTRRSLPVAAKGWSLKASREGAGYALLANPAGGSAHAGYFFPADPGVVEPSAPQALSEASGGWKMVLKDSQFAQGASSRLRGVLVADQPGGFGGAPAIAVDVPVDGVAAPAAPGLAKVSSQTTAAAPAPTPTAGLLSLLGMALTAFVGGTILNLMPCVFPVLSIKILGFVQQAGDDRRRIAHHGWAYTFGVLVSFWTLAGVLLVLRAGGNQLAWGYQLQSPLFVIVLCGVLFALSLSLLGVYEIGAGVMAAAGNVQPREGLGGAVLSGMLATLLATPCTAPFMGAALAFALTQPAYVALGVFTALAAGMAAPYLVLSMFPAWLKFLPRPGAWMDTLKQFMAFPLMGSIVWLLWVFGLQTGMDGVLWALSGLLTLGLALWLWGRYGALHQPPRVRTVSAVLAIVIGLGAGALSWSASNQTAQAAVSSGSAKAAGGWEPFTAGRLAELKTEGRPVFVDFGAAWCATCIVNDRMVIDTPEVQKAFKSKNVALLRADWTKQDPEITKTLAAYGKRAVPFHLLYGDGGDQPLLAKDLVAKDELMGAIAKIH